jgi:Ca2+-transporting ATPase
MVNIFIFLSLIFILIFILGKLTEKLKIPWIFSALLIGSIIAIDNPFTSITSSSTFVFLANLGMYFLLFIIGFEIDLNKFEKISKFIFKLTFFIILFEAFFGMLIIHFIFGYNWFISFLVGLSFATVGEAVLIPILDEFKIINTKLGQSIIGVGLMDDIIEIFALTLIIFLISPSSQFQYNIIITLISIFIIFLLTYGLTKLKEEGDKFGFSSIENLFLFTIFILFIFIGIGEYGNAASIAALFAGIGLKTFIPKKRLELIENEIRTMCYGFFAPIFLLWVGINMDINYLITYPLLIFLIVAISSGTKILGSYLIARKRLKTKNSILLGIGLSVKFSTSIIIIKLLFDNGLITSNLYSVIVASSIIFTFAVPILFSNLLVKWKLTKTN